MEADFKNVAISAAKEAGFLLLQMSKKSNKYEQKSKYDIITKADLETERIILNKIKNNFPDHDILSEEKGKDFRDSDYLWVVDPLDGTINFSQGLEEFATSIALQHRNKLILGVVYHPVLNNLYIAQKGKGSFLNGKKITVSKKNSLIEMVGVTESAARIEARTKNFKTLVRLGKYVRDIRIMGSTVLHLARVAASKFDFYFNNRLNYWDVAAGVLLIEEAGGKITDFQGRRIFMSSKNSVACNKKLQNKLRELVNG